MLLDNKGLVNDCLMKLDKVTDDTWEDILDRYELDYSQDHLRKMAYGMRIMRDTMEDFNEDEVLLELKKEKAGHFNPTFSFFFINACNFFDSMPLRHTILQVRFLPLPGLPMQDSTETLSALFCSP